ncbi:MAG: DUF2809 domain-containing protein [Saprospiraceae bacterium]
MNFTFNKKHFLLFLLLFGVEVLIAVYLKSGFIRHTIGDFLVTILVYCFLRSFIKTKPLYIAIATLAIAFATEFLQLTNFLEILGLGDNKLANIVFGTSFSIQDLVAYTLGVLLIWMVDRTGLLNNISRSDLPTE